MKFIIHPYSQLKKKSSEKKRSFKENMFLEENQVAYKIMRLRTASDFSAKLIEDSGGFQKSEGKAFQTKNSLPR